jgi:rRNA small subunit pseudouridine methyltransferase Nep1
VKVVIVLADAELELVPEIKGEMDAELEAVQSMHSIPVLDAYFHHDLVKTLSESGRRGRPDIVHNCLSLCQNSIPNRKSVLHVYVHTRDDKVIEVEPGTEIPPNYIKFLNDMGILLKGGSVPGFKITSRNFRDLIQDLGADLVVALTPSGQERSMKEMFETRSTGTVLAVIGGFPEGDYKSPVYKVADVLVSLGPRQMRAPEVVSEVLQSVPKIVSNQHPG